MAEPAFGKGAFMQIESFQLERYFARYEFNTRYLLSSSDCESLALQDLMALADDEMHGLWDNLRLGYTESAGHPLLRAEIASLYARIPEAGILCAAPEEAIFIAMNRLLQPGDRVVTVWPAYQSLFAVAKAIGCEVTPWSVQIRGGRWNLDLDQLKEILPGARLLVLNFPHNPTGFLPERALFEAIIELAEREGVLVFSDEMYRLLECEPAARLPAACDLSARAVSLSGLSKAFGLPGLRAGWLACQDTVLLGEFQAFKDYTTICASAPGEILAIVALRARDAILARCQGIVRRNLALAELFFSARDNLFTWLPPDAGSIAFPGWKGGEAVEDFCAAAVEQHGLMIVPSVQFGVAGNHFRLGLGRENFPEALAVLKEILHARGTETS
jgi:aspartate/methionine/tyrosine aminotransferase